MADGMIRARLTLNDGVTPGAIRQGSRIILACIARGCRIVDDPLNSIPEEWGHHVLKMDEAERPVIKQRGRPKKVKP
jgi:hypothetical protein